MRLQHVCSCAACDFDKRMADSEGLPGKWFVAEGFEEVLPLARNNIVAFAYNMDDYTNVFVEVGLEWCQSYH